MSKIVCNDYLSNLILSVLSFVSQRTKQLSRSPSAVKVGQSQIALHKVIFQSNFLRRCVISVAFTYEEFDYSYVGPEEHREKLGKELITFCH